MSCCERNCCDGFESSNLFFVDFFIIVIKKIVFQNAEFDSSTLVRPLRSDLKVSLFSNMVFKGGENPVDITKFK